MDREVTEGALQLSRPEGRSSSFGQSVGERERLFQEPSTPARHSRRSYNRGRSRRVGVGDILASSALTRVGSVEGNVLEPLEEYAVLSIIRILDSGVPAKFVLQRLLSRRYHIGPEGAVIGSSSSCDIKLPLEARLKSMQFCIKWNTGNTEVIPASLYSANRSNHFSIEVSEDCSFVITKGSASSQKSTSFSADAQALVPPKTALYLTHGICFITESLEWCISAPSKQQVLTMRMFDAVRKGNLERLKSVVDCNASTSAVVHAGAHYGSSSESIVDVNTVYEPTFYDDEFSQSEMHSSAATQKTRQPSTLLHIAINNGDLPMVNFLLEKGAKVNLCVGDQLESALHLATRRNAYEIVMQLLDFGGDTDVLNKFHLAPLTLATCYKIRKLLLNSMLLCAAAEAGDHSEVVKLISSTSVTPNACALRHKNALQLAAANGYDEIVSLLISKGANVNLSGGSRMRTALHYASLNNCVSVAELLLDAGANECACDVDGYTPRNLCMGGRLCILLHKQPLSLCLAVQSGDAESVEQLLNSISEQRVVDQRNEQSHAPLHLACAVGILSIVKLLISHGADVNIHGGSDAWTPLFYAAMAGHVEIVEFLLVVGADLQEVDHSGVTLQQCVEQALTSIEEGMNDREQPSELVAARPLFLDVPSGMSRQESHTSIEEQKQWARDRFHRLRTISKMLLSGPDRLLKAIETRDLEGFRSVLQSGVVDPDTLVDRQCPTSALVRVCEDGLFQFVETLLAFMPNLDLDGAQSEIPLHVAAANGRSEIVQLLLQAGANVNKQSSDSLTTALHEAAGGNHTECVQKLLESGANMSTTNVAGETPFDCTSLLEIRKLLAFGTNKLIVAACTGEHTLIKQMIKEQSVNPNHEFHGGYTALHKASEAGHVDAVRELLLHGADANKHTHDDQLAPLHLASLGNHLEVAEMLLASGAKLDCKNSQGKVPIEVARTNQMRKLLVNLRSVQSKKSSGQGGSSERFCMICMDQPINTIILPCGHQAFCAGCVARIDVCALDRIHIREVIKIYK